MKPGSLKILPIITVFVSACGGGGSSLPADATVAEQIAAVSLQQGFTFSPGLTNDCTDTTCDEILHITINDDATIWTQRFIQQDATGSPTLATGDVACTKTYTITATAIPGFGEDVRQQIDQTVTTMEPADCFGAPVGSTSSEIIHISTRDEDGFPVTGAEWSADMNGDLAIFDGWLWEGGTPLPMAFCKDGDQTASDGTAYCNTDCSIVLSMFSNGPQNTAGACTYPDPF